MQRTSQSRVSVESRAETRENLTRRMDSIMLGWRPTPMTVVFGCFEDVVGAFSHVRRRLYSRTVWSISCSSYFSLLLLVHEAQITLSKEKTYEQSESDKRKTSLIEQQLCVKSSILSFPQSNALNWNVSLNQSWSYKSNFKGSFL